MLFICRNQKSESTNVESFIRFPYLYFKRNWADYYGFIFVSKHIRIHRDNYSRGHKHKRTYVKSEGEIKRTQDSNTVTIPFRTRNTVRNRLNRMFALAKNPKEQMRFAKITVGGGLRPRQIAIPSRTTCCYGVT